MNTEAQRQAVGRSDGLGQHRASTPLPSIIGLHGFARSPRSFQALQERLALISQQERLPRPAQWLVPSISGHGTALPPRLQAWRFEDEVDRIAEVVRAESAPPRFVCGYSLGGRLALGLLARHADAFAAALIISAHGGLSSLAERQARRRNDAEWAELLRSAGIEAFAERWGAQGIFSLGEASKRQAREVGLRQERLQHDPDGLAWALERLGLAEMPCWEGAFAGVACTCTLVAGEKDAKFVLQAERISGWLAGSDFVTVPQAGHDILGEAPEQLARCLVPLLRGVCG